MYRGRAVRKIQIVAKGSRRRLQERSLELYGTVNQNVGVHDKRRFS